MRLLSLVVHNIITGTVTAISGAYASYGKIENSHVPAKINLTFWNDISIYSELEILKNVVFELNGKVANPLKAISFLSQQGLGLQKLQNQDFFEIYPDGDVKTNPCPDSDFNKYNQWTALGHVKFNVFLLAGINSLSIII